MNFYLGAAIIGLTLITALTRRTFLLAGARIQIPVRIQRARRWSPSSCRNC